MSIEPGKPSKIEWWPLDSNGVPTGGPIDLTGHVSEIQFEPARYVEVALHGGPCDGFTADVRESLLRDGTTITASATYLDLVAVYRWRDGRFVYDPEGAL